VGTYIPTLYRFRFCSVYQLGAVALVVQGFINPKQGNIQPSAKAIGNSSTHHFIRLVIEENSDRLPQLHTPEVLKDIVAQAFQDDILGFLSIFDFLGRRANKKMELTFVYVFLF
jgi:hypothetical protein